MNPKARTLRAFKDWYSSLPSHKPSGGPARGTIGSALVVLERLKNDFDLDLDTHRAAGKSQIKGASGAAVARILANFGETRSFLKEGGRTNRGGPGDIGGMLEAIATADLNGLALCGRNEVLKELQSFLVDKVREYHSRQRLRVVYDPSKSTWSSVHDLLNIARDNGKEGPVAQYLVGAKLELRFPQIRVENDSYSTADDQLGRHGDFLVGDTVFHVTVSPMAAVYQKCTRNLREGLRVYLLVPDARLAGTRQNAEATMTGKIAVESIESFVSQNIEELSVFESQDVIEGFRHLLETYNKRVDAVETDKSMLFDIPRNLR